MVNAAHIKGGGADEEFPILCETCLGENPYVRMTREPHGKACKICDRPFTVYRWRPGPRARYKKTELCHTCAKLKNVCQTCVLDLEYGLPVQVRDSTLEEYERQAAPKSDVTREFMIEQAEMKKETLGYQQQLQYGKAVAPSKLLSKLSRRTPYYKRNLPHVCSFYAKGECNRGDRCPYRHEMPLTGELAHQNIKDRYFGNNDPVAAKMLRRSQSDPVALKAPDDATITTLWVGGVTSAVTEADLRARFSPFGPVSSVRLVTQRGCAFITFIMRSAAEDAAKELHNNCTINGASLRLAWGKKRPGKNKTPAPTGPPTGAIPAAMPPPSAGLAPMAYPSQDPRNMSTRLPTN